MRESAMLFEPIVDIRDVLESFLVSQLVIVGWKAILISASARLVELGQEWSDDDLVELGNATKRIAIENLLANSALARVAADDAARLLATVRIPGVPHPEDEYWAF